MIGVALLVIGVALLVIGVVISRGAGNTMRVREIGGFLRFVCKG